MAGRPPPGKPDWRSDRGCGRLSYSFSPTIDCETGLSRRPDSQHNLPVSHPYKLIGTFLVSAVVAGCSSTSRLPDRLTRVPGVRGTEPAGDRAAPPAATPGGEIGRASCRERV